MSASYISLNASTMSAGARSPWRRGRGSGRPSGWVGLAPGQTEARKELLRSRGAWMVTSPCCPLRRLGGIAIAIVTGPAALWGVFLVAQVLVHLGIERGLDGELDQLLGEGAEIFSDFDVFGQLSGQCFECMEMVFTRQVVHGREWSYGFKPDNKTVPLPCYPESPYDHQRESSTSQTQPARARQRAQ